MNHERTGDPSSSLTQSKVNQKPWYVQDQAKISRLSDYLQLD